MRKGVSGDNLLMGVFAVGGLGMVGGKPFCVVVVTVTLTLVKKGKWTKG